jgi:dTDP-4-amino-4,6-dideoxygalactose transaminase
MNKMKLTSPKFDDHEIELIKECLDSRWVTQGPRTEKFEALVAAKHKVAYALATTSCTAALHLSTMALELGSGDEVIVPAFTWITSANAAEYVGATVRFAEVESDTFNLDPEAYEAAITPNTRAVVVVHLFGLSAKMDEILAIAEHHHHCVIEDAACAIGTTYSGRPVGGFGDFGCFSFHPRKVITTGEGGMIVTNKKDFANRVRSLRNHGATGFPNTSKIVSRPYYMGPFDILGYNLRLSDIQAAVGIAQMAKLEGLLSERQKLAKRYNKLLQNVEEIAVPVVPDKCGHTYQSYVIRVLKGEVQKRNQIMEHLDAKNIQTRPGTHAVHRLGYYTGKYHLKESEFPVASTCEDTTITLPLFPGMTAEDQKVVTSSLVEAISK